MPIRPENKGRYPKDWKLRSRFVRFYRARNRCEWCGCENYQPHPVTGSKVVLTVAHVHDDRPEASQLLNLAALCQRCHNRHDMKDRARRRKERIEKESGQMNLFEANAEVSNAGPGTGDQTTQRAARPGVALH
jgi:5-methylcytosine-specific restriction endonuclease McrA